MRIKLVAVNGRYTHSCLALYYLRNELERHLPAESPELLQFSLTDPYYQTLLRIADGAPDIVFFSVYIWSGAMIRRLAIDLAALQPTTIIVLGGPQAPFLAADLPVSCTVVAGEVEGVPGDFYTDLAGGRLARFYQAHPGQPFAMPYRGEDFASSLRHRQIYYESSRGCPFACSYCLSASSRGVSHLDLDLVRQELALLLSHRPGVVRFVDRTYNASPDRALELWRFLLEQPGETCFHFEIAPELFTEEMFDFLATVPVGRFQFEIGLQSTNPETLAAINRRADMARIRANVERLLAGDNIHLHVDLILGLPFETRTSFHRSINDVLALAPHYIQMGLLKILPDTPINAQVAEFGIVACQEAPREVLATRWLDAAALADLYWLGECIEAFYNNRYFRAFFACLRRRTPDLAGLFQELLELCRGEGFFEQARTQKLMNRLLLTWADSRPDRELLRELLRFDWLRSGHGFLPEELEGEPLAEARDRFYHALPRELPPLYGERDRNRFFRRAIFLDCSAQLLCEVGLADTGTAGTICLPPDRTEGILGLRQAVLLPASTVSPEPLVGG